MKTNNKDFAKKAAAQYAANLVKEGMLIGIGSGSTAAHFIDFLGKRCAKEKLHIKAVATSEKSKKLACKENIAIIEPSETDYLDLDFDGADEIDEKKQMIKGGGGALLREKIVAYMSREMVVIIDESKLVKKLGTFPLPVEIVPFAASATINHLAKQGFIGKMRLKNSKELFITDNGNYIYDIYFENVIDHPLVIERKIKSIPGVVETGLFIGVAGRVIIGHNNGSIEVR
ncbi:Ribose-5-phosphate isomerase A [Chlamydiales bacterium STE3]|nr:Ribose-5-phosphate isomerase A [Chlamydiales bacterium STE3]